MSRWPAIGILAAAALAVAASAYAQAGGRCLVTDPTGSPLNVRSQPKGVTVGELANGQEVKVLRTGQDANGRAWAYVGSWPDGRPIGWVFRAYLACS